MSATAASHLWVASPKFITVVSNVFSNQPHFEAMGLHANRLVYACVVHSCASDVDHCRPWISWLSRL